MLNTRQLRGSADRCAGRCAAALLRAGLGLVLLTGLTAIFGWPVAAAESSAKERSDQPPQTALPEALLAAGPTRLPPEMPVLGCWFWTEAEFKPEGYRPFLDLVAQHSAFNLLTTSLRAPRYEVTEDFVRRQIGEAANYALRRGMRLVMDLDVRLARVAFQQAHPDELQEMLRLRDVPLNGAAEVPLTLTAETPGDHYTFATTPYVPVGSRLVRVYFCRRVEDQTDPDSVRDITSRCRVEEATTNQLRVVVPGDAAFAGGVAIVAAAFAHLTPDVFAPHLMEFQRAILRQYGELPLGGACKDEWGFPPCFDGCPAKNDYWFSAGYATAYARSTGGRDLARDCVLMWRPERGRERERQAAINHYQRLAWQRNAAIEADFRQAVKDVFGPTALAATHPTWWPNPDAREFKKNGLDWWAAPRDLAQTDEVTPFAVRTALAKRWGGAFWVNMFYAPAVADYERALWSHALGGGRINFHPLYPTAGGLALESTAALLRGDLQRGESRLRLLQFVVRAPLDCPVAVIFGHASAMNWAGPHYNDVGLDLANELWRQGFPADLIPADEIEAGALRVDPTGWVTYGPQRYAAAVLYHPEFEPASTADFAARAAEGRSRLWRVGERTSDFEAQPVVTAWPGSVPSRPNASVVEEIVGALRQAGHPPQTLATASIGWDTPSAAPPRTGHARLVDGTVIWLAGEKSAAGDPLAVREAVEGNSVEASAVGLLAIRFDAAGRLAALAASGLRHFRGGGVALDFDRPLDFALWTDSAGRRSGVIQDGPNDLPPALRGLATDWLRLTSPTPAPSPR